MSLFNFDPVVKAEYSESEVTHELISSVKSFHFCKPIIQEFHKCRKMPFGKTVSPESCLDSASRLMHCYSYVKQIPKSCLAQYNDVRSCLDNNSFCESQMQTYVNCSPNDPPSYLSSSKNS